MCVRSQDLIVQITTLCKVLGKVPYNKVRRCDAMAGPQQILGLYCILHVASPHVRFANSRPARMQAQSRGRRGFLHTFFSKWKAAKGLTGFPSRLCKNILSRLAADRRPNLQEPPRLVRHEAEAQRGQITSNSERERDQARERERVRLITTYP